jgi:flagellar basal body L-ring protein FlgH
MTNNKTNLRTLTLGACLLFGLTSAAPLNADVTINTSNPNPFSDPETKPLTLKLHDLIHVIVTEKSSSEHTMNAKGTRSNNMALKINKWMRLTHKGGKGGHDYLLRSSAEDSPEMDVESSRNYNADGTATSEHLLTDKITGEVVRVYPNGDVEVVATKTIRDNDNVRTFKLTGHVSMRDFENSSFTVKAENIAELCIEIKDSGQVSEDGQRNWLQEFLSFLWPF